MPSRAFIRSLVVALGIWAVCPAPAVARVDPARKRATALAAATHEWKTLAADKHKRDRRDLWMRVIGRFDSLAHDASTPAERGAALLKVAEATENMATVSRVRKDYEKAIEAYHRAATDGGSEVKAEALAQANRLEAAHGVAAPKPAPAPEQPRREKPAPVVAAAALPEPEVESADAIGKLIAGVEDKSGETPAVSAEAVKKLRSSVLADGSLSVSEQVGLKVRRIIVDAGHGGHDQGASGPGKTHEKDVTLAIAKELARQLKDRGYEVVLTRDHDDYLALEERTAIANKQKGDLFISIHANASPSRKLSGVETYSLNVASNRFAMRLAARENSTLETNVSDLQYVLADLATRANTVDSDRLARSIQGALVDGVAQKYGRPKDNGVKHALFYVLLGAKMPAVLVETQFISNPREEKRLASASYQALVAKSIAAGVDQFVSRRQTLASIDR